MHRAVQTIRRIARHEIDQRPGVGLGVVKSVHGNDGVEKRYACTVVLRDTGLVLPKVPIATGLIGTAALPRENDLVVVLFVGGDLHGPVVIGRLFSDNVAPPEHGPGELVTVLPGDELAPEKRIELRVAAPGDGSRALRLTLEGPVKVELEVDNDGVRVRAQDALLRLTQTGASDGRAELSVGGSKITLTQDGDVTIEASGTLTLKGAKVNISGDASVKVAGTSIDLN